MPSGDEFRTSDISVAAYTLAANLGKYRGINWNGQKAVFVFRPGPDQSVVSDFLNDAPAPAKRLLDCLRALRTNLNEAKASH